MARQGRTATRGLAALLAAAALALLLAPGAAAHPESAAASLRPDVARAWHDPPIVQPGTHFVAALELRPGHNVTAAHYQVCETRVAPSCFAPPHPAQRDGDTFRFHSAEYLAGGRPVEFQPGWRLGIKWILNESRPDGGALVAFPPPPPGCALECLEGHYLVFDVADAPAQESPAPMPAVVALAAALAAHRSRRHA